MSSVQSCLLALARETYLANPKAKLEQADVRAFCPACAEKMARRGLRHVRASAVASALGRAPIFYLADSIVVARELVAVSILVAGPLEDGVPAIQPSPARNLR